LGYILDDFSQPHPVTLIAATKNGSNLEQKMETVEACLKFFPFFVRTKFFGVRFFHFRKIGLNWVCRLALGRVARFLDIQYTKNGGKCTKPPLNYQQAIKYNQYIPNGRKIYQHLPFQGPPICIQIGIFGLKIYHLATLVLCCVQQIC
jgi:hypothetical protein